MIGQTLIYAGIGIAAASLIAEIVLTIVFSGTKKRMIEKIYKNYEEH
ncbi:MAG: hypothetical protein IKI20_03520 [Lachnospiraceae bacterium]|nr:hypothetical protein [Lachnospiraceae bacterium]